MSNIIPPLVCTTPPPICCNDGEESDDDEFGDFTTADDTIYGCDSYSNSNSPEVSPRKVPHIVDLAASECGDGEEVNKDFQDKRKELINCALPTVPNGEFDKPPIMPFDAEKCDVSQSPSSFSISFDDPEDIQDITKEVEENIVALIVDNIENTTLDDFADFSSALPEAECLEEKCLSAHEDADDEFGDFGDYASSAAGAPIAMSTVDANIPLLDNENVSTQAEIILKQMFQSSGGDEPQVECAQCDFTATCTLFKQIQDVTDTNALSYQWGKSQVQKDMLKALSIDTRNILFAPGTIKSDILIPTVVGNCTTCNLSTESISSSKQSQQMKAPVSIPSAQFDWSEAGLANPFDAPLCLSAQASAPDPFMRLMPLQPALKSDHSTTEHNSNLALEDWDVWLYSAASKEEEQGKLAPQMSGDTLHKFEEIQSKQVLDSESVNSLQFAEINGDQNHDGGLETTLEEDQSRQSNRMEPEGQSSSEDSPPDDFSDFTSFQSVHKEASQHEEESAWPSKMIPLRETYIDGVKNDWGSEVCKDDSDWLQPTSSNSDLAPDDDFSDFQDFQSTELQPHSNHLLTPTLLEPVRMQQPQQILWPEPGISDEELARFDLYARRATDYLPAANVDVTRTPETKLSGPGGSLMVEKSVVVPASKVILPFNEVLLPPNNQVVISKDLVLPILESSPRKYTPTTKAHDDDWCEFVSSKLAPRSAATELPLSIPQLSCIQPSKPPIPVITAHGLVQTKIPTLAPGTPLKSLTHVPLHVDPPTDGYQPATISAQFAAHQTARDELLQYTQCPTTAINTRPPSTSCVPNGVHDDDEWSEFMSSQPTTGVFNIAKSTPSGLSNGFHPTNGLDMPNIIMNPVHFQSYATSVSKFREAQDTNGVLHCKKPMNLNVARLPDLDFVAPKAKICQHSKK